VPTLVGSILPLVPLEAQLAHDSLYIRCNYEARAI
jgi:hypothetical protein